MPRRRCLCQTISLQRALGQRLKDLNRWQAQPSVLIIDLERRHQLVFLPRWLHRGVAFSDRTNFILFQLPCLMT